MTIENNFNQENKHEENRLGTYLDRIYGITSMGMKTALIAGMIYFGSQVYKKAHEDVSSVHNIDYSMLEKVAKKDKTAECFLNNIKNHEFKQGTKIFKKDNLVQVDNGNEVQKINVGASLFKTA